MKSVGILFVALALSVSSLFADSPAPPRPYVAASPLGMVYFKMIPRISEDRSHPDGLGIAYLVQQDGPDKELWRTEGWYSFEVFLSNDGRYLVAMGPWHTGRRPKKGDLAVSFYKEGKLLRQYSITDLVKDDSRVRATVSHYFWLARDVDQLDPHRSSEDPEAKLRVASDEVFFLKTCDGILYEFDITTGDIKRQRRSTD